MICRSPLPRFSSFVFCLVAVSVVATACDPDVPSGVVRCDRRRPTECPDGYVCTHDPRDAAAVTYCYGRAPERACWPSNPRSPFFASLETTGSVVLRAAAVGPGGRICAAGGFSGTLELAGVEQLGTGDALVVCWSSDGSLTGFARSVGEGTAEFRDLDIGPDGSVYAAGFVDGVESFGRFGRVALGPDLAVVKFRGDDLAADPVWAVLAGNTSSNVATAIDQRDGRVCITGASTGFLELAPGGPSIGGETQDGFVACFDLDGGAVSAADVIATTGADTVFDLAIGADGVYLTGEAAAGASFDAWIGVYTDGTLARERRFGDVAGDDADAGRVIALEEESAELRVFFGGFAAGANEWSGDVGVVASSGRAGFVARARADLHVEEIQLIGAVEGARAEVLGLGLDRQCVFASGWFEGEAEYRLMTRGGRDTFVAGYDRPNLSALGAHGYGGRGEDRAEGLVATDATGPLLSGSFVGSVAFSFGAADRSGVNGVVTTVPAP